jgi:aminocarboxymuconate-semialdehyde decarboxylase
MIIDIHGHITHPELFKRYPMPPALADIDGMIEQKLQAGIGLTIVGSPVGFGTMMRVPGHDNYDQTEADLRGFHDWLAETVARYPGRLKAYCYLNPFGGDRVMQETARRVREEGFVGLIVNTSVRSEYLDSDAADAFFDMAADLDVPVFLHPPSEPVGSGSFRDFRLVEQVGRFGDVTAGLAVLAFSGRMEKFPNLRVIGATAGGAISLLPGRLDNAYQPRHWSGRPGGPPGPPGGGPPGGGPPAGGGPPGGGPAGPIMRYENKITQPPSTYIRRIYVDTATPSAPTQIANLQVLGAEQMLFGTDSPPLSTPLQDAIDTVRSLPVSEGEKEQILAGNARRLFRLDESAGSV